MKTCVVLADDPARAAEITAAIPGAVYTIVARENLAMADLVVVEAGGQALWFTRLRPLAGIVETLDEPVRQYLLANGILETPDLARLNLDQLATAPGVGPRALQRFIRELAHSNRYPHPDRLQELIVRRGIFI